MEAVARSRQRDAGLASLLERRQSNDEAAPSHSGDEEEVCALTAVTSTLRLYCCRRALCVYSRQAMRHIWLTHG